METTTVEKKKEKEGYLKILSKTKESILVFAPGVGKKNIKWDEFNEMYDISKDDPFKAYLKPEYKEKFKKINEIFTNMATGMIMSGSNNAGFVLQGYGMLGGGIKEVCKISGMDMVTVIKMFKEFYNRFIEDSLNHGIGFGKSHHKMMSNRQIARSNQNIRKINREAKEAEKAEDIEYGCSIGDIMKAKNQKL